MDSNYEPGLDVIVIDYRTPLDLSEFIASYYVYLPHIPSTLHVGLVQPTSKDEAIAKRIEDRDRYYVFEDNVGYAKSVNAIAVQGNREMLAIFNADCVLEDGVLQECYDALLSNPEWGVLGPRQVNEQNRLTHGGILGTSTSPMNPYWLQEDVGQCSEIDENAVSVVGAAFFIERSTWDTLTNCPTYKNASDNADGAFLPTPHFYEETACAYHARAHGWKAVYYGPARMIHKVGKATPLSGWAETQMVRSREIFREFCDLHGISRN